MEPAPRSVVPGITDHAGDIAEVLSVARNAFDIAGARPVKGGLTGPMLCRVIPGQHQEKSLRRQMITNDWLNG